MRCIESVSDLLSWAREINSGVSLSRKCDMQDIYARSNRADLDRFFIEANGDRRLIICSVSNCMAFEEVEHLLGVLAKAKVAEEYAELDKKWAELKRAEVALDEAKSSIGRRMRTLTHRAEHAVQQMNRAFDMVADLNKKLAVVSEKAKRFDLVKELLK